MKCIRNLVTEEITRVSDEEAAEKVATQKFQYTTKSAWRAQERNGDPRWRG